MIQVMVLLVPFHILSFQQMLDAFFDVLNCRNEVSAECLDGFDLQLLVHELLTSFHNSDYGSVYGRLPIEVDGLLDLLRFFDLGYHRRLQ